MTTKVAIEKATVAQLRQFATGTLGLELAQHEKRDALLAKISAVHDKAEIAVEDEEQPHQPQGAAPRPVTDAQQAPAEEMVRVYIDLVDGPGGKDPVFLSVNGVAMLVPRGEEVDIKERYYHALCNAVTHRFESLKDGGMNPVPRKVPAYPFRRVA